ncbi:MAG: hypothetical protein AB8B74_13730 [Crocinitomicaceae bacterium]
MKKKLFTVTFNILFIVFVLVSCNTSGNNTDKAIAEPIINQDSAFKELLANEHNSMVKELSDLVLKAKPKSILSLEFKKC